ncbi:MAG: hypothetical protein KGL56_07715 [Alphaproteobacteria bacterium]|nr:hypothetical protein [Alphaproteobacteria bacterium]
MPHDLAHDFGKLLYFKCYFGLSEPATLAVGARKPALWWVFRLTALGSVHEILQGFTGRDPDIFDECGNNILGATANYGLGWLIVTVLRSKTELLSSGEAE